MIYVSVVTLLSQFQLETAIVSRRDPGTTSVKTHPGRFQSSMIMNSFITDMLLLSKYRVFMCLTLEHQSCIATETALPRIQVTNPGVLKSTLNMIYASSISSLQRCARDSYNLNDLNKYFYKSVLSFRKFFKNQQKKRRRRMKLCVYYY